MGTSNLTPIQQPVRGKRDAGHARETSSEISLWFPHARNPSTFAISCEIWQ